MLFSEWGHYNSHPLSFFQEALPPRVFPKRFENLGIKANSWKKQSVWEGRVKHFLLESKKPWMQQQQVQAKPRPSQAGECVYIGCINSHNLFLIIREFKLIIMKTLSTTTFTILAIITTCMSVFCTGFALMSISSALGILEMGHSIEQDLYSWLGFMSVGMLSIKSMHYLFTNFKPAR